MCCFVVRLCWLVLAQIVFENELFTWCMVALACVGATLLSPLVSEKIALGDVSLCVSGTAYTNV